MSRACRNMGDSGKHRVPPPRTRLEDAALHNLLPHLYPASLRSLRKKRCGRKPKTKNGRREKRVQNTPANDGIDRRESYHFPQVSEGKGAREKRENVHYAEKLYTKTKCESAGVEGAEESKTSRAKPQAVAKMYQNALRTKPNPRARNGHHAPPCGGDVETGWRIARKTLPGKLSGKLRTKNEFPPKKEKKSKPGKPDQNTRGQWWPERQLATTAPRD